MFDACTNRALEAARTIEDVVRFGGDDSFLTREWKQLRHALGELVASVPASSRAAARDTSHDVGTGISTASEAARDDLPAVLAAGCQRLKQSLRSIEEAAKLLDGEAGFPQQAAASIEALRYRCYTLEKATLVETNSNQRLADARLYWLSDGTQPDDQLTAILAAGIDVVQLRDKTATDRELLARGKRLRRITREANALFIINDRPDLAALCDADGVHVGQDELSVSEARRIVGVKKLVGVSTHSLEQARAAVLDGANYLGVGPTFPGATKQFDEFPGLAFVEQAAKEITLPWFAIGGIDEKNLPQVLAAGATRVAVSGALAGDDAVAVAERLKTQVRGARA